MQTPRVIVSEKAGSGVALKLVVFMVTQLKGEKSALMAYDYSVEQSQILGACLSHRHPFRSFRGE